MLPGDYTIKTAISVVEAANSMTISYTSSAIDSTTIFSFSNEQYLLKDVMNYIFRDYEYEIISYRTDRLVLKVESQRMINLYGFIYDDETDDHLQGALIEDLITGDVVYTNENGYYSMEVIPGTVKLAQYTIGQYQPTHTGNHNK